MIAALMKHAVTGNASIRATRTHAQQIRKSLDALHMEEITNTVVHALRSPTPAEKAIVASMPADTTANR